jgi:hypothetical protein
MRKIVSFSTEEIDGLARFCISMLYVEVSDDGECRREVGLDAAGAVVHCHPGNPTVARYGLFDLQSVHIAEPSSDNLPLNQFEALWSG